MNQTQLNSTPKPDLPPMGFKVRLPGSSKIILLVVATIVATILTIIFASIVISDVSYALKLPFKELGIVEFSTFAKTFPWTAFGLFSGGVFTLIYLVQRLMNYTFKNQLIPYKTVVLRYSGVVLMIIILGLSFSQFTSLDNKIGNSNLAYKLSTFKNFTDKHIIVGVVQKVNKDSITVKDDDGNTYDIKPTTPNTEADNSPVASSTADNKPNAQERSIDVLRDVKVGDKVAVYTKKADKTTVSINKGTDQSPALITTVVTNTPIVLNPNIPDTKPNPSKSPSKPVAIQTGTNTPAQSSGTIPRPATPTTLPRPTIPSYTPGRWPFKGPHLAAALEKAKAGGNIKVTLPQGPIEPQQAKGIDAEAAGVATWNGNKYTVIRDWNEDNEGAYLIFTKGQIDWNNHKLVGVYHVLNKSIENQGVKSANIGNGSGGRYLSENPNKVVVSDVFGHGVFHLVGVTILGAIGDLWRPLTGSSISDFFLRVGVVKGTSANKHYDGMQFHNKNNNPTGENRARQTIQRGVFAGIEKDPATGQPLGAMNSHWYFSSDNLNGSIVENLLSLDASGVWYPARATGTGKPIRIRNLQLMGKRGPPQGKPNSLAPAAYLLYSQSAKSAIDFSTIYIDVPGVAPARAR